MDGSRELFLKLPNVSGLVYSALVPNLKGMEEAIVCGVRKTAVFTAASETFNQKNIHASIAESIQRFEPVVKMANAPRRGRMITCKAYEHLGIR